MVEKTNTKEEKEASIEKGREIFNNVLEYETQRYKRKGFGLVFAWIFAISFFYFVPLIGYSLWPKDIQNEGHFTFWFTWIEHHLVFSLGNLMFYIIYKLEHPFFEKYKTTKDWPWNSDPEKWRLLRNKSIKVIAFNSFVVIPLTTMHYYIFNYSEGRVDYESLPNRMELILTIGFFMVCEDLTFYLGHSFLHLDFIYPYVHKIHHEYTNSVSYVSEYTHPLEFFINISCTASGSLILGKRAHYFSYAVWTFIRIMETTDGHCGYEFSWTPYRLIPFSASQEYHNFHHQFFKGNYGSFMTIWDRIFQTQNKNYLSWLNYLKEKENKLE